MRRNAAFAILSLLVSFLCSACAPAAPSDHPPEFLNDIGKTLIELKNEHPEGELIVRPGDSQIMPLYVLGNRRRNLLITFSERRAAMLKRS